MKKYLLFLFMLFIVITINAQQTPLLEYSKIDKTEQVFSKVKGQSILWSQSVGTNGYASQDFEEALSQYDCQAADDFIVSMGPWNISTLSCFGTGGFPEFVNVYFYNDDSGSPGDLIVEFLSISTSTEMKDDILIIHLPEDVILDNGTYWVSIVARMDSSTSGQWFWSTATTTNGAAWQWRNPNNGFGTGATDWAIGNVVLGGTTHDMSLAIYGYAPNRVFANCVSQNKAGNYFLGDDTWNEVIVTTEFIIGGTDVNGVFYGIDYSRNFGYYDETMTTWTVIGPTGIASPLHLLNLTYDPVSETLYTNGLTGAYPNFDFSLYSININTGVGTLAGTVTGGGTILAIASDLFGNLYAVKHIPEENGAFYSVNKTDASLTFIGDMEESVSAYYQSMAFDFRTNACYFQVYGTSPQMKGTYKIDVNTGTTTRFGEEGFVDHILGIGIPYSGEFFSVVFSVYGANGAVHAEFFGNNLISGSKLTEGSDITFTAIPNSGYKVKVWAVNGAQQPGTSNVFVYENLQENILVTVEFQPTTSVDEISLNDLKVFPNPFIDEVFISNTSNVTRLIVSNILGVVLLDVQITGDISISTSSFSKGVYFLNFTTIDGNRIVRKVVKQ
jgi:hypothetical protein